MNNRKIQGIVFDFLDVNAASELITCIFNVSTAAASTEPKLTITEHQNQKMSSLLVFVLKLQNELNAPAKIRPEGIKQDLDLIFKELEATLYNAGLFLDDSESFELMKKIKKLAADYNGLIEFIHEKVKA
jgi:Holliday junction resolvase RusA-like endonuclease